MRKGSLKKSILLILFLLFFLIFLAYNAVNDKIENLKTEKYNEIALDMKNQFATLVEQKQKALNYISLAMAQNELIQKSLVENNHNILHLDSFSNLLKENTDLHNIWFHIVNSKGESFYKSWSDKRLENILALRDDIAQAIQEPKISQGISVGKYSITFKSIVPIYTQEKKLLGLFETIAQFRSITQNMLQNNYETMLVVDKRYTKQLSMAEKDKFEQGYYIPTKSVSLDVLEGSSIATLIEKLQKNNYLLLPESDRIATVYVLKDLQKKPMAYMLLFTKLSAVSMQDIIEVKSNFMFFSALLIIIFSILLFYLYLREKTKSVEQMNEELEKKVSEKTASLEYLAYHDFLTKLPNRFMFTKTLETIISDSTTDEICVVFLDLDNFKDVNDSYGHIVGDKLLKKIAQKLKALQDKYKESLVARLGGDEFTILLRNAQEVTLVSLFDEISTMMNEEIQIDSHCIDVTFSMGISRFPEDAKTAEELLRNADIAMYKAKEAGKNRYRVYNTQMSEMLAKRLTMTKNLQKALENEEFSVYFQPQVNAVSNRVTGAEALIRWIHPENGVISPGEFMPLAEDIGLIIQIDEWMMQRATKYFMQLYAQEIEPGKLSLNLSSKQLSTEGFVNRVEEILRQTGFEMKNLELEILEGQIVENEKDSIKKLSQLKSKGVTIAVDDFGTGYSSLSYIKKLPISKLKIDKSFVDMLPDDEESRAIVFSIITIAKHLGLQILAEGVEDILQKKFLVDAECINIQGYLYSKPLCCDDFKKFLLQSKYDYTI